MFIILYSLFFTPAPIYAHGFGQRIDLPVPFGWILLAASFAVLISFILLAIFSREAGKDPEELSKNVISTQKLSGLSLILKVLFTALFILTLISAFFGNENPVYNFAPIFVWITWTVGLTFVSALAGNAWSILNPWKNLLELFWKGKSIITYPSSWQSWPAVLFLFGFLWFENISSAAAVPKTLGIILLFYSVITFLGMIIFGFEDWIKNGEFFSNIYYFLGRFAPLYAKDGQLKLRKYGVGLLGREGLSVSQACFILLMLAGVSFDGFKATYTYFKILITLDPNNVISIPLLETVTFLLFYGAFILVYFSVSKIMAERAWSHFILSIIPIAVVYELAHFTSLLLVDGQRIIYLISDPLGMGWNLFGTASYTISSNFINFVIYWMAEICLIVIGHIIAVWVSHREAMMLYERKKAILSQYPMLVLMIGYTIVSLWIISQPVLNY